jgi:chromosome partitioning protein
MIIAIANQGASHSRVADHLAALRSRSGRKVLLLDTVSKNGLRSGLENLQRDYNDIIIDTEGNDTLDSRSALIAARLAVVPVHVDEVDLARQYKLIDRLNSARMFNPGLRVVFVIVGGFTDPSREELAAVRAYVAQVMSAILAGTVLHALVPETLAADMGALYREVFAP